MQVDSTEFTRTTVMRLAPYWMWNEIQKILGQKAVEATREGDVDEMRQLTEAVAWLKQRVYTRDATAADSAPDAV